MLDSPVGGDAVSTFVLFETMSLPKAIVMVVMLAALGAYVYFIDLPQAERDAKKETILTFEKDAVDTFTLIYPDRTIRLKQVAPAGWDIIEPIQAKADKITVDNMLNTLADEEVTRHLDPDAAADPALYGLDEPLVRIQLALNDGTKLPQLSIGKDTPVGYSAYVQKEGDPQLHLTRQAFRLGMIKQVKELRDKTILPFVSTDVKKIAISGPEENIVLAYADTGWTLEQPAAYTAEAAAVLNYLSTLQGMRAEDFIEQPLLEMSDFGLDPAQLTVSLQIGADTTQTISIGNEKAAGARAIQRYVKRDDGETLYLIRAGILKDLSKAVNDFRDKTVASIPEEKIEKVEVRRQDGGDFTITHGAENKWEIDTTQEGTLKTATLSQFIADLRELRGFEIAADNPDDLSTYGLDTPALTLIASDEDGERLSTVLLGQTMVDGTEKRFAMQEGGKTVFTLRDYVFSQLNKKPADFWEQPEEEEATAAESADSGGKSASNIEEEVL